MTRAAPQAPAAPRLVVLATRGLTPRALMRGQLAALRRRGFDVTVVTSPGVDLDEVGEREQVATVGVPMRAEISPLRDLLALWRLFRLLRRVKPEIVLAGTAKAGMLGMLAARMAGVPVRAYHLRGLRLETTRGLRRRVLAWAERLASRCADRVVCVGPSLLRRYAELGLAPEEKLVVLGHGSSAGIDLARFPTRSELLPRAAILKERLGIPADAPVVGFVGRLVRDKGVAELLAAMDLLSPRFPQSYLLIVGQEESGDPVVPEVRRRLRDDPRVIVTGWVEEPAAYYAAMDVLAFPSHREGFPNAVLEAAAAETPTAAFAALGTVDAVVDGAGGTLVPLGDVRALADALGRYLADPTLRAEHGRTARARAAGQFSSAAVHAALIDELTRLLVRAGLPLPRPTRPDADEASGATASTAAAQRVTD